ncbi:MAG: SMP-30/gluconolactonase/LRE family protein [Planctomycetota bacterium]
MSDLPTRKDDMPVEMDRVVAHDAPVRKLADGFKFLEGPVWLGDRLVFSDIPASKMYVWSASAGVSVYRDESHNANGNTTDSDGHLYTCEGESRCVSITEPAIGGERRVLVDSYVDGGEPLPLNRPNDVVVHPKTGAVFFTDPVHGMSDDKFAKHSSYGGMWVFRLDAGATSAVPAVRDFERPNGLCFSPDLSKLYINDDSRKHVRVFDLADDGSLSGGTVICEIDEGVPDGMRVDTGGRLFVTAGDGVHVFQPDGTRIGKILCPESPANCRFGGDGMKTLFMTSRTGLYAVDTLVEGI